jgi:serine/threonine protein kinase
VTSVEILTKAAGQVCRDRGFSLEMPLGRGAFKSAFLIRSGVNPAALKIAEMGVAAERLQREVDALRSCEHSSIARIHEAFPFSFDSQQLWVVIEEYLAGGTLEARLQGTRPPPAITRSLGLKLTEALVHLRERSLVHRDIKPANILFRDAGADPVLTDFGIVRMLDAPSLTADFAAIGPGTPAYAAPEQLSNEKHLIDWRTDQFGLALVLCECLLGRHAFQQDGESVRDAIIRVAGKGKLPATAIAQIHAAGFPSLVKALEPWPVNRHRRPTDFIAALQNN